MHIALPEATPLTKRKVLQALALGDVLHLWVVYQLDGFRSNLSKLQALPSALCLASRVAFLAGFVDIV